MSRSPFLEDLLGNPCATEETTLADSMTRELLRSAAPARPTLVLLSGLEAGKTLKLTVGRNRVGRVGDVDVLVDDDSVSRSHCNIMIAPDGGALIEDLKSTNGTMVGTRLLRGETQLMEDGDLIRLSATVVLKFAWQDEVEEAVQRNLYNASVRDGLTGIYNKRYLQERFEQEYSWASRNGRPLSVVVFDLDHFKAVNDTYGHDAGDIVLKEMARRIQHAIRREDVVARFGGEEFVLLMRETDIFRAIEVSERVRRAVRKTPIVAESHQIRVTTSAGVASSREPGIEDCASLFGRADRRLYAAKTGGRDKIVAVD